MAVVETVDGLGWRERVANIDHVGGFVAGCAAGSSHRADSLAVCDHLAEQPVDLTEKPDRITEQPVDLAEQPDRIAEQPDRIANQPVDTGNQHESTSTQPARIAD